MLKLMQMMNGKEHGVVYVSARHVVAVYPDRKGNGCHIELVTNANPEEPVMHVAETAEAVSSHEFLNSI